MTPAELATLVRFRTRTNSTTFPDSEILALLKVHQKDIAEKCQRTDSQFFHIYYTENLEEDQRQYPFQTDIINRLIRVEAKLDETNFIKLYEEDEEDLDFALSETEITERYSNNEGDARFLIYHNSIYILSGSISAVTNGLKIYYDAYPDAITDLTSTTDMATNADNVSSGLPSPLHSFLVDAIVIDWKSSREKPIPLTEREQVFEVKLQTKIDLLRDQNREREIIGTLPDDGFDHGYNL